MRESVLLHEESLRLQRMCRELKKRDHLSTFLRRAHDAAIDAYTRALGDDEFGEALDPPPILGINNIIYNILTCTYIYTYNTYTPHLHGERRRRHRHHHCPFFPLYYKFYTAENL